MQLWYGLWNFYNFGVSNAIAAIWAGVFGMVCYSEVRCESGTVPAAVISFLSDKIIITGKEYAIGCNNC